MPTTQFKPFAIGIDNEVTSQVTYSGSTWLVKGWTSGILPHSQINKVLRQATVPVSAFTQVIAEVYGSDLNDDGDIAALTNVIRSTLSARLPYNPGISYPVGSIGYYLNTTSGSAAWFNADAVKTVLASQLTPTEFASSLVTRINLIDTPVTGLVAKVADLETLYGPTTAASTSAANAAQSLIDATAAMNAAALSAGAAYVSESNAGASSATASGHAATASSKATEATNSAASASGSASTATTQAGLASSSASAAAGSASAANTKAGEAATSASDAATFATASDTAKLAAQTAKGAAEAAQEAAASSASSAAGSASTATTQAGLAAGSASDAGFSATAALNSANTATTQAGYAGTAATVASTSAGTATTKAADASSNADAAFNYASSALASETVAGSYASSASTSANTATTQAGDALTYSVSSATSASNSQLYMEDALAAQSAASTSAGIAASAQDAAAGHASAAYASASAAAGSESAAATHYTNTVAATGALTASVETLETAVAGPGGLEAQHVLKVVATRSDGKKVFGLIGVASTAPNDGTGGESGILLQADGLVFVPSSNINAPLTQLLEVGLVDGVNTLRIPAASIGDLTVSTLKIADVAVNTSKLANNAATVPSSVTLATNTLVTQGGFSSILSLNTDTEGRPLLVLFTTRLFADPDSFSSTLRLTIAGTEYGRVDVPFPFNGIIDSGLVAVYIPSPPSGNFTIVLEGTCDGAPVEVLASGSRTFMYTLGTKK